MTSTSTGRHRQAPRTSQTTNRRRGNKREASGHARIAPGGFKNLPEAANQRDPHPLSRRRRRRFPFFGGAQQICQALAAARGFLKRPCTPPPATPSSAQKAVDPPCTPQKRRTSTEALRKWAPLEQRRTASNLGTRLYLAPFVTAAPQSDFLLTTTHLSDTLSSLQIPPSPPLKQLRFPFPFSPRSSLFFRILHIFTHITQNGSRRRYRFGYHVLLRGYLP